MMPCDDCLSRREFLARGSLAMAGAAALASGCGNGQFGPEAVTSTAKSITFKVASLPGLATVGQVVRVPPDSAFIVAKRTGTASFIAFSMICTHQGCETLLQSSVLACPCHGSRYDSDGHVTRQPSGGG